MNKLFLSFLVASFLSLTALSANCGMNGKHKEKCDMPNCKIEMKKADCKMPNCKMDMKKSGSCGAGKCGKDMMKKAKCDMPKSDMKSKCNCKNGGDCKCKTSGKECKCGNNLAKTDAKMCACGMTQDSCKKMMVSCKHRDAREAKEAQNK